MAQTKRQDIGLSKPDTVGCPSAQQGDRLVDGALPEPYHAAHHQRFVQCRKSLVRGDMFGRLKTAQREFMFAPIQIDDRRCEVRDDRGKRMGQPPRQSARSNKTTPLPMSPWDFLSYS